MKETNSGYRIPIFDGLKGVAILTIIGYYFFEHIMPGGFIAVNLFLVIAGFFNFRHFYVADQRGKPLNYIAFIRKRFERLFFPMLAMIMMVVTYILLFNRNYLPNVRNMGLSALGFFNNYYQILNEQSYFVQAANPSPFTHLWYVSLYGQSVILTPILIFLTYSWHKKANITINILLIISLVSAVLMAYLYQGSSDPTRVYYDLLTRLSAFTLGGALGLLLPERLNPKPIPKTITHGLNGIGVIVYILAFFMVRFMFGTKPFAYRFGLSLFSILSLAMILTAIHPSSIWNKVLSFKVFSWIGKRSFSYYLWYYPVYLLSPQNIALFNRLPGLNYIFKFALIIGLAEITYQLFEQKSISLPVGQDFNWKKTKYQFNFLRNHPQGLYLVKFLVCCYIFNFVMGTVGMAISSQAKGTKQTQEIEQIIESNLKIADETKNESAAPPKVVNHIEGLDQEVLLFASGLDITFIGDSTLAASTEHLKEVFPKAVIDPQVARQLYNSYDVVDRLKANNQLASTVVTMLGTNGTYTTGQLDDYIQDIGLERKQYYVNILVDRPWTQDANYQLNQAAERYGNVTVIDWASFASGHAEWFASDGVHLNEEGAKEFSKFMAKELYSKR